ncbi:dihydroxyacetone kinase family protein [Acidipropionibacterium jensenii]|uniref:dihydroxyacetone kinase family protein n=2 Tax=Acidipropionibacterium jensenii TaxID=1749 RepID=UPI002648DCC5|nr:dihydroxyacetone kinase family protein [Acidipropionibacterium jensenii]MDN5976221.1 dihydroxyacetone kinase family protein [Acidipropionibacterium jensenii]MDN5995503.1 dihydroxyacetone kinase family protein [Acidipropionibacterium jensenii]MDN6441212.1 dihydroxyacetone kinase family protein [Acidipropionibacterium jensenii]MDN6479475.1 dihydroxyacetone kinase family protein [Acidipropionibacterium jensenii]MDN6591029.1 dihydroxyacetone kinase family protein [Acidipropionibacterium jenseni
MTRVLNDPDDFPAQAVAGLASAFPQHLKPVFGGVARATVTRPGKVALVVGGGSGHYPAFAGWVGQGFADGAVCGNIFSSPSGAQAYSVCKAADRGAGVLIGFGNYAGDVLQFGQAAERLKSEGIDTRCLLVTDDIASAGPDDLSRRRGIAGDLPTFKVTGAACEAGLGIDEVVEVFNRVNHRTRSFGVAFKGCTLPGADQPLFRVAEGRMGVGMGIHGEPGIHDADLGTADDLAQMLVDGLLADRPEDAGVRVVPIVNGLGDTKYEELFVIWNDIRRRLVEAGLEIVDPQVGEFVTSLDMAGLSLTLVWLDEVIEPLWLAPCDTPAYRRGAIGEVELDTAELSQQAEAVTVATPGSPVSQEVAGTVVGALDLMRSMLVERQDELGRLDSIAGDGDHGIGMARGSTAAVQAAREVAAEGAGALTTLAAAGAAWSEQAGGTSGALWGAALTAFGSALGDDQPCRPELVVRAAGAALEAVTRLGGAQLGDKTMVDAMEPFVRTLQGSTADLPTAWGAAVLAADQGARSTAGIVARLGRSRPLGEKSLGTPDPGAVSFVEVVRAVGSVID